MTTIDCNTRLATLMLLEPLMPLNVAVMLVNPAFRAVTSPEELTDATPPMLDNQVAVLVTS